MGAVPTSGRSTDGAMSQKCPQSSCRRPVPSTAAPVCPWSIPMVCVGPARRHEALVGTPPHVPACDKMSTKGGRAPKPQPDTRHQAARAAPSSQGRWLATGHHCSGWDVAVTRPRPRPSPAHLIPPLGPSRGRMLHPVWDELGLHHQDQQPRHIWGPFSCSLGVA